MLIDMKYLFISPTKIILPRKTKDDLIIYLNLNVYRNLHFQVNNLVKSKYNILMFEQLHGVKFKGMIKMKFRYVKGSHRISDKSNVLCIVEKFWCDAMIVYECIEDDNDDVILSQEYLPTRYDKHNSRVEIEIEDGFTAEIIPDKQVELFKDNKPRIHIR